MPMSSGLLTINAAVRSETAARSASTDGYPFSSSISVTTLKPAAAAVAPLHVRVRGRRRARPLGAPHPLGEERRRVADARAHLRLGFREDDPAPALARELHHERLVPDGGVVPAERHRATTSCSAVARR